MNTIYTLMLVTNLQSTGIVALRNYEYIGAYINKENCEIALNALAYHKRKGQKGYCLNQHETKNVMIGITTDANAHNNRFVK